MSDSVCGGGRGPAPPRVATLLTLAVVQVGPDLVCTVTFTGPPGDQRPGYRARIAAAIAELKLALQQAHT